MEYISWIGVPADQFCKALAGESCPQRCTGELTLFDGKMIMSHRVFFFMTRVQLTE